MNEHQQLAEHINQVSLSKDQQHEVWATMNEEGYAQALELLKGFASSAQPIETVRDEPLPFPIWGEDNIDPAAIDQMRNAMRLPVSVAGALMPDAHVGYGLPIGGVLAVDNAVIPYAVGVDIGCRVVLSVFSISADVLGAITGDLTQVILDNTRFGVGCNWADRPAEHPVLDTDAWNMTPLLRSMKDLAAIQLGTSGGGNHFVEWGVFTPLVSDHGLDTHTAYLALLSHSGSRKIGMNIANHYSKLAESLHPTLPNEAKHLSWLSLDTDAGQEYWLAMNLAGQFATANHDVIHGRIADALGERALLHVDNHHNFAWEEDVLLDGGGGTRAIVHRKGATPAAKGVPGFIPGSMGDVGFLVEGNGVTASLNSASHGAGRQMGRKQATRSITRDEVDAWLSRANVTLIGGGLDEAPQAYKRIEQVMADQQELVTVRGTFHPRIVRMADDGSRED